MHADVEKRISLLYKLLVFVGGPWLFASFPKGPSVVGTEICLLSFFLEKALPSFLFSWKRSKKYFSHFPCSRLTCQRVAIRHTAFLHLSESSHPAYRMATLWQYAIRHTAFLLHFSSHSAYKSGEMQLVSVYLYNICFYMCVFYNTYFCTYICTQNIFPVFYETGHMRYTTFATCMFLQTSCAHSTGVRRNYRWQLGKQWRAGAQKKEKRSKNAACAYYFCLSLASHLQFLCPTPLPVPRAFYVLCYMSVYEYVSVWVCVCSCDFVCVSVCVCM